MNEWVKKFGRILALPTATAIVLFGARFVAGAVQSGQPAEPEGPPITARIRIGAPLDARACLTRYLIGTVKPPTVGVSTGPSLDAPVRWRFNRRSVQGGPQVFLLENEAWASNGALWYRALLPVRPNGTFGFIQSGSLRISATDYHLVVNRHALRLSVWKGCEVKRRYPIGLGTKETPTPVGSFYLASLLKPPRPDTVYGAYAYGLSGYSPVIRKWRWGGIIGLHGTNHPSAVGHYVSHGCIRMRNPAIKQLVRVLPLGTPITIK